MTDVCVGLFLSCGCIGSSHRDTCDLITRLPIKTTAFPGKYFVQLGTIQKVDRPADVYSIKYPVSHQFELMVLSPLYNKIDDYGESLAYCHVALSHSASTFVKTFIETITSKLNRPFNFHKNYKLFVADNMSETKHAFHFEPFSIRVGGFCIVEASQDYTVDFMNKRKYIWTHTLSAVDGAELNNQLWNRSSAFYRAKWAIHRFLWVAVFVMIIIPLAVHNMKDHDAECLQKCCDRGADCLKIQKYWGGVLKFSGADTSGLLGNLTNSFNLSSLGENNTGT